LGQGHQLGAHLRRWLEQGSPAPLSGVVLANVLVDALGAEEQLKGPVRDLANQPLFVQLLRQQGGSRQSSLMALRQQLASTYSPSVLAELDDLLAAATGEPLERQPAPEPAAAAPPPPETGHSQPWSVSLRSLAPGLAAAAAAAPVLAWLGHELDRLLLSAWGWSGGVGLAGALALLQALSLGPLRRLRRGWPLNSTAASDPHQLGRWITAPWCHANCSEGLTNLVLLLILLGSTPLPASQVVLRYSLTALAALAPAALVAQRCGISRQWSGASGAISALVGLAAGLSLLQGRSLGFAMGALTIPAWVLLLVYGALQLGWQLPRQDPQERSAPLQRLLASSCSWGLLLGLIWALISWVVQQLPQG
jgi:membrane associated rhomboid family serine protease